MGGNVWQWCEDWYDATGTGRVLRGASWSLDYPGLLLASFRYYDVPDGRYDYGGFRCVVGAESLRWLTFYRLRIDEMRDRQAVTIYTRRLEAVQVKDENVSVAFNPEFKRIWLEVKKRLIDSAENRLFRDSEANMPSGFSVGQKSTSEPRVFY